MYRIRKQIGGYAFGWPGAEATWSSAKKIGVGTAFNYYSKVWFTIAQGIVTEVYYPTLDTANCKELKFVVTDKKTFVDEEADDMDHIIELIDPKALAYRIVCTDKEGKYRIIKRIITDYMRNSLIINCKFEALCGAINDYRLYVYYDPHIDNSGGGDTGYVKRINNKTMLLAYEGNIYSALATSIPWKGCSTGFIGVNDGLTDLKTNMKLNYQFDIAENGNIAQVAKLDLTGGNEFNLVLSFGRNEFEASSTALATLNDDYEILEQEYLKGWNGYCSRINQFDGNVSQLYLSSVMIMKAFEDKTYPGAMVASMSIPWGEAADDSNRGGYHLVWGRDLYHTATAFIAAGDLETANRAIDYLDKVQQRKDGSFPQNSWLNGHPYWGGVQMDEVADPIILAWRLGRRDLYFSLVKPAAEYIIANGPCTQQERWEENSGYSPASIAAQIAGLVCAASLAKDSGDYNGIEEYLEVADHWQEHIDKWCFTTTGFHANGRYYLRISPHGNPNTVDKVHISNGGGQFDQREVVDPSFLEMVRLGVKAADDPKILSTLKVVDSLIRVETKKGVGWYRYNHDGYGETKDGKPYTGMGIGRIWPIFTGERGHYEIALGNKADKHIKYMEAFANEGYILPEQVWEDSGEPTGSATPLAWSHAEYVRLVASKYLGRVSDTPSCVFNRYVLGNKNI
ncbi:MAG: glucan 1,4-alpha-glucosidase [Mahellales bacterium]